MLIAEYVPQVLNGLSLRDTSSLRVRGSGFRGGLLPQIGEKPGQGVHRCESEVYEPFRHSGTKGLIAEGTEVSNHLDWER